MTRVEKTAAASGFGSGGVGGELTSQGAPFGDRSPRRDGSYALAAARGDVSGDAASFLGLPAAELTPSVHRALNGLLTTLDGLRRDLAISRERQEHWLQLANAHPVLPMSNRRAFIRELAVVIEYLASVDACASLVIFHLVDLPLCRATRGLVIAQGVSAAIARALISRVRTTDVVGCLGDSDFAAILTLARREDGERKAALLAREMSAAHFPWAGEKITSRVSFGVHEIRGHDEPEKALDDADRNLRARTLALPAG